MKRNESVELFGSNEDGERSPIRKKLKLEEDDVSGDATIETSENEIVPILGAFPERERRELVPLNVVDVVEFKEIVKFWQENEFVESEVDSFALSAIRMNCALAI
jgi:hypothetical protein